jgi:sterol 3beta-glucosyltransferase
MMRILILTFGTRGDIQPYVALGAHLRRSGHQVVLSTADRFREMITGRGIAFYPSGSNVLRLITDAMPQMRGPLDVTRQYSELKQATWTALFEQWAAARATRPDMIIYHPKCEAGPHLGELLGIPAVLSVPIPLYTPTREFPLPVITEWPFGGRANRLSYSVPRMTGVLYGRMINNFRLRLGLRPRRWSADPLRALDDQPTDVIYPISRHVVPVPADYPPNAHVTGYWFLPAAEDWQPDPTLVDFLDAGPPPVYVGFGSMGFGRGSEQRFEAVRRALQAHRVRGVVATGWGGLAAAESTDELLVIDGAPHDWLFPQMAAVVHHGGAGTTAAGLAAGRPSLITPFFGDQRFWGHRVHKIGAGPAPLPQKMITADLLAPRIGDLINTGGYRHRAATLATKINSEHGAQEAVRIIEDLATDRALPQRRAG